MLRVSVWAGNKTWPTIGELEELSLTVYKIRSLGEISHSKSLEEGFSEFRNSLIGHC